MTLWLKLFNNSYRLACFEVLTNFNFRGVINNKDIVLLQAELCIKLTSHIPTNTHQEADPM